MSEKPKQSTAVTIIPKPKILAETATSGLSKEEQEKLKVYEQRVETGLNSFTDVAKALMEIKIQRLHRPKTWEDYLKERWHMSRAHGNRFIDAAAIIQHVEKMSPMGDIPRLPQNERAYRLLRVLTKETDDPQEAQIEVLKAAAENTADAPDIGASDILQAAVKVEIAKRPVNKGKRRQKQWQGLKTQFQEVLKEIDDKKIVERLQTILAGFTGLMEPQHKEKAKEGVAEAGEKPPKGKAKATRKKPK